MSLGPCSPAAGCDRGRINRSGSIVPARITCIERAFIINGRDNLCSCRVAILDYNAQRPGRRIVLGRCCTIRYCAIIQQFYCDIVVKGALSVRITLRLHDKIIVITKRGNIIFGLNLVLTNHCLGNVYSAYVDSTAVIITASCSSCSKRSLPVHGCNHALCCADTCLDADRQRFKRGVVYGHFLTFNCAIHKDNGHIREFNTCSVGCKDKVIVSPGRRNSGCCRCIAACASLSRKGCENSSGAIISSSIAGSKRNRAAVRTCVHFRNDRSGSGDPILDVDSQGLGPGIIGCRCRTIDHCAGINKFDRVIRVSSACGFGSKLNVIIPSKGVNRCTGGCGLFAAARGNPRGSYGAGSIIPACVSGRDRTEGVA